MEYTLVKSKSTWAFPHNPLAVQLCRRVVCRRYKPIRTLGKVEAWNTQY